MVPVPGGSHKMPLIEDPCVPESRYPDSVGFFPRYPDNRTMLRIPKIHGQRFQRPIWLADLQCYSSLYERPYFPVQQIAIAANLQFVPIAYINGIDSMG